MPKPTVKQLRLAGPETEISLPFLQGMVNRMMTSFHKYGPVAEADEIDCYSTAWHHMCLYRKDGNTEHLVDAANYLMMEFGKHPDAFRATDADESGGRVRTDGEISVRPNR